MKKSISLFTLILMLAGSVLSAHPGNQLFFELSPNDLKEISESTQQVFEQNSENPVWFGLVFDTQLTAKRQETVTLELPGFGGFFLERETLKQNDHGILVWNGKAYDSEGQVGTAQFALTSEGIDGYVAMNGDFYLIAPIGNSIHRITLQTEAPADNFPPVADLTREKTSRYWLPAPSLSLQSEYCFGLTNAAWNPITGATYYDLRTTNGTILYIGPNTDVSVDFGCCSNVNIVVKACNSYGCGAASGPAYAVYYSVCY